MNEPRRIPIHRSLQRPILIAGADRELVVLNACVSIAIVFSSKFALYGWVIGGLLGIAIHVGLVMMAKIDPQMREVYLRHIQYQDYYPARASEQAPPGIVRRWG